jgi:hypothetical protein
MIADRLGLSATGEVAVFVHSGSLPPANHLVIQREGDSVRLHCHVGAGRVCEWQQSSDLHDWTVVASTVAPPHGIAELVEPVRATGHLYYRATQK